MTRMRRIALVWILLASGFSIWFGSCVGDKAKKWVDFRAVYYGTRCLLEGHNPYNASELERVYLAEGGKRPLETSAAHQGVTLYVNLPTTFLFVAPFALLPYGPALVLWMTLTAVALILASYLMWNLGAAYAPKLSLILICILLANCEMIFGGGNTAGLVVGLGVIAAWCFVQERFIPAGIFCLAVSLAMKPHDAGLVWLYFLLVGGVCRKRALQTLIVTAAFGLPAFLWVSHIAPGWVENWNSNLSAISAPGGINEPGPASVTSGYGYMVVDLQTTISVIQDDSRIYNAASYLICGALLLAGAVRTHRRRFSRAGTWIALAAIAPLTILVTYHRPWDAKLLMLAIPGCAMLCAARGPVRWFAMLLTTVSIIMIADIPLTVLAVLSSHLRMNAGGIGALMLKAGLMRPVPLVLLAMGIFYLWIYMRSEPVAAEG